MSSQYNPKILYFILHQVDGQALEFIYIKSHYPFHITVGCWTLLDVLLPVSIVNLFCGKV